MANKNPNRSNLKPWPKGVSGNPDGKEPGTKNRATVYKKWLDIAAKVETPDGQQVDGTVEDEVILSVIKAAKGGDIQAAKEILDSLYGKVSDKVQVSGDPDAPVIFQVDGRFKDKGKDRS